MLLLLELNELQLTERLEDVLKILFVDREMDVADVETVEWNAVRLSGVALGVAGLAVFLCFSELRNDRDAAKLLPGESDGFLYRSFVLELDVSNTVFRSAIYHVHM